MSARLCAIVLAACASLTTLAGAAPFGLHAGDRPPSFSIARDNGDGTVVVTNVPAAYPGLIQFFARYDETNGLCSIGGTTAPFEGDSEGIAARSYFDDLVDRLSSRYGRPTLYSFVIPRGGRANSWTAEIATGNRFHYAFWHGVAGDDARSIALSIGAGDGSRPFVLLSYDFANFDSCAEQRAIAETPAL